jgi:hypothetical protein
MSTEFYVKRAHPQCVAVIGIRKIHRLETDVYSAISGMDAIHRHEALRGPSAGIDPIVLRYLLRFSTALVPELKLQHLCWLVSVESVGDMHSRVTYVLQLLCHGYAAPIIETH